VKPAHTARLSLAIALALAALLVVVYWQVHSFDFINYDDNVYIQENPQVSAGLTRAGVIWAFATIDYFYWQPLTWLSHMLDCQWFGLRPGWHHLTNLFLHILNSLLVFFILRRLTGTQWRAAVAAGLFALHPLRVESVAWIAERKDVLSCFWFLVALGTYVLYVERPSSARYRWVLGAMLLGLMSKPMLVTVPFLFLLIDYWPLRRVAIAEKIPMLFLGVIASLLTVIGTHRMGAMDWSANLSLATRISNSIISYTRYLGKTFWPARLSIFYPYPASIPLWQVAAAAALLAAMTIWIVSFRTRRYLLTGWLWFLIALAPTIGIVQVGRQAMADRFAYIPSIGLLIAIVWGGAELLQNHRRLAAAAAILSLAACAVLSWHQTKTWRDSTTVFTRALEIQESSLSHRHLGAALAVRGDTAAAIAHFQRAIAIEPRYFIAHYDLGNALEANGDSEKAEREFAEAIRCRPTYGDAYFKLGEILVNSGRSQEGLGMLHKAMSVGMSVANTPAAAALLANTEQR